MVLKMLELSSCSTSAHTLTEPDQSSTLGIPALDTDMQRYVLALPEAETWRKHRLGLTQATQSCSLLEPETLSETLVSRTASYDALYDLRARDVETAFPFEGSSMFEVATGVDSDFPLSPHIIKRRRGGLIEQKDIIKAHEAHKMQSTPQARRKEW
ncbi:voltage-dependent R-type calcium channel subunit alpha-1E isoform X1, partial [Pelobates cultripes]